MISHSDLNQYINVVLARAINRPAAFSHPGAEEPGWPVKSPVKVLATADLPQEAGEVDKGDGAKVK